MKLRTRILRDAQDLIQSPDRWRQGGMETRKVDGTTRRCMTGAICHAAGASEVEIGSNPIIDEAIAASEPCEAYRYPTTPPPCEVSIK